MKIKLYLLLLLSCSTVFAQTSKGAYELQRRKNALLNKSVISGTVIDFSTNQPLKVAIVKIDTLLMQTDTLGQFQVELPPGKHRIRAGFVGYYLIDIRKINVQKGELITILFRIKEDSSPLID